MTPQALVPPGEPPRTAAQRLRLSGLRLMGRLLAQRPAGAALPPSRLLVIRPDHLGDVLFTTPALALLRASLPGAHITSLCGPWSAPLLAGNPRLDAVLTCEFPWFNRRPRPGPWSPYAALFAEARRLRGQGFDAALVLRFDHWWGAWLAAQAGIPLRAGYDIAECRPFLTTAAPYQRGRHEVQQDLALAEAALRSWGVSPAAAGGEPRLEVYPRPDDKRAADALVGEAAGAPGVPLVAIHPGAGAAVKLWPAERWAAVGDALVERRGARVIVTGSAAEADLAEAVAGAMKVRPLVLAGRTSLMQLAALFGRCDLVLGSDSGPLHLAVAAGAPTVHLFGPVDAVAFGPWGPAGRHVVVRPEYPAAPCHGRPCDRLDYPAADLAGHPCMALIPVDRVLAAAEGVLAQRD